MGFGEIIAPSGMREQSVTLSIYSIILELPMHLHRGLY